VAIVAVGEVVADLLPVERSRGHYRLSAGGAPANLAAQAAHLGRVARIVGAVGDDPAGWFIRRTLRRRQVDTHRLVIVEAPTTLALGGPPGDGRGPSVYVAGTASALLTPAAVPAVHWEDVTWLAVSGVALWWDPLATTVQYLMRSASRAGVGIALDLNWRPGLPVREDAWARRMASLLNEVEIVKATTDEWRRLTQAVPGADRLAGWLLLTAGAKGATLYAEGRPVAEAPALQVRVRDTVGAGDAFLGTWLAGLDAWAVRGRDLKTGLCGGRGAALLKTATAAASLACRTPGAMRGLAGARDLYDALGKPSRRDWPWSVHQPAEPTARR
jgi:fructokinase